MVEKRDEMVERLSDGMRVTEERIGFDKEALLECSKCLRANSPLREICIYCGTQIARAAPEIAIAADRSVESWALGFNVVLSADRNSPAESAPESIPGLGDHDRDAVAKALQRGSSVPIRRFADRGQATAFAGKMLSPGLRSAVVADQDLEADRAPTRLRSVAIDEDSLILTEFNSGKPYQFPVGELRLIVRGVRIESRIESSQKRKLSSDGNEETRAEFDGPLLDLYLDNEPKGFRILPTGFDFSSLGPSMTMIAGANLDLMAERLSEACGHSRLDREYASVRDHLAEIWPLDEAADHLGGLHSGYDRKSKTTVRRLSNISQFTKYSRLQNITNEKETVRAKRL